MATRRGTRNFEAARPRNAAGAADESVPPSSSATRSADGDGSDFEDAEEAQATDDSLGAVPDLLRKLVGIGLSGFFLTESTIRKAVGDTIPKDWVDFAVDQSDRTRAEFLERLSLEVGRSIENIDFASVFDRLMDGRTLEINARIRLGSRDDGSGATKFRVSLEDDEEAD